MSTSTLDYVTQKEVDTRFSRMEALFEKNAAHQEALINEVKGDVKAQNVMTAGIEKRIDDIHESQNKWFTLFGILLVLIPIAVELISRLTTIAK